MVPQGLVCGTILLYKVQFSPLVHQKGNTVSKSKKNRYIFVAGIIVIVVILAIAFVSAGTTNKVMSVAEASQTGAAGQKVEVTGNVVDDSYSIKGDTLTFSIYDTNDPEAMLMVVYDKGVAATFGNGVTAICKGTIGSDGTLQCNDLVTKCPSKYETATDALGVSKLLGYGEQIYDKPVKVQGVLKPQSLADVSADVRFILVDTDDGTELPVSYASAIPTTVKDSSELILTGSLQNSGVFAATDLAEAKGK